MTTAAAERRTLRATDREETAGKLLDASAKHSLDPWSEIDWESPEVAGAPFTRWSQLSLFGTVLWEQMSVEQRIELSRQEIASTAATGLWFEGILMQMLLRHTYDADPRTRHVSYALTEVADECRHSMMFARLISTLGAPAYRPRWLTHNLARLFKSISTRPVSYAGTLVAEEILDALQRDAMRDEQVQPLCREVCRVHVVEEARHVRFAREELIRLWPRLGRIRRAVARLEIAIVAHQVAVSVIHRDVYAAVGLDPRRARRAARSNPHWRANRVANAERITTFLADVGVIPRRGPVRLIWRRAWLLA
jgi:hypothetical protein